VGGRRSVIVVVDAARAASGEAHRVAGNDLSGGEGRVYVAVAF
jgi:hypothetical protein